MSVPVQRRRFPARTVRTVMAMYRLGLPVPGIRRAFPTMDVDMILRIKTSKEDDRARSDARPDIDRLAGLHPLAGRAQETPCAGCGQADGYRWVGSRSRARALCPSCLSAHLAVERLGNTKELVCSTCWETAPASRWVLRVMDASTPVTNGVPWSANPGDYRPVCHACAEASEEVVSALVRVRGHVAGYDRVTEHVARRRGPAGRYRCRWCSAAATTWVYPGGDPLELSTYSGRTYSVHPSLWSPSCDEHAGGGR